MADRYWANGKLLLSAEYFILSGASALVLPVRLGQSLEAREIENIDKRIIDWKAYYKEELWFEARIEIPELTILDTTDKIVADRLQGLFKIILKLNPSVFENTGSIQFTTHLDFNPEWGLGSSSTIIANLAAWAKVEPMKLFNLMSTKGSGYDIIAAGRNQSFIFARNNGILHSNDVELSPKIKSCLYFVYSGVKQNSNNEIINYKKLRPPTREQIGRISAISRALSTTHELSVFEEMIKEHEKIIGNHLHRIPVKEILFPDFPGEIKSLGAWGGDFLMFMYSGVREQLKIYLEKKGLSTFFSFDELQCN